MIGFALFFELGGVWEDMERADWQSVRSSVGAGLRITTPFGVARLDFGVSLNSMPDEPKIQFHFSMGQAF